MSENKSNIDSPHYGIFPFDPNAEVSQLTLDQLLNQQTTPGERGNLRIIKRKGRIEAVEKGKKGERLFLDEGTRDALPPLDGRVYTPEEGVVVRNLPPEKRDSAIVLKVSGGQLFFAVKGREIIDNSVPYFEGFVLQKGENKSDPLIVMALGYARKWDIQGNNNAAD